MQSEREAVYIVNDEGTFTAWTDNPAIAKEWRRLKWPVTVFGLLKGKEHSWEAQDIPADRMILRKLTKEKPPK